MRIFTLTLAIFAASQILHAGARTRVPDTREVISIASDGSDIAYVYKTGTCLFVAHGDSTSGPFEYVGPLRFMAHNGRLVYEARVTGTQRYIYCGQEKAGPFRFIKPIDWAPDSASFSYVASNDNHDIIGTDEKYLGEFPKISRTAWSPSGKILSFNYEDNRKSYLSIGGKTYGPFDDINDEISWSPDEHDFAFTVKNAGKYSIVTGKKTIGPHEKIAGLTWLPKGTLAYCAKVGDDWHLFPGGGKIGSYERLTKAEWTPDGKKVAYAVGNGDNSYVITGDKKYGPYHQVMKLLWSSDGGKLSYSYWDISGDNTMTSKYYVAVNGKRFGPYGDAVWELQWSPDGKDLCYSFKIKWEMHFARGPRISGPFGQTAEPFWSPDGKELILATSTWDGKWYLVREDGKIGPYKEISDCAWSSDGKYFMYRVPACKGAYASMILIQGKPLVGISTNGALVYLDGSEIVRE